MPKWEDTERCMLGGWYVEFDHRPRVDHIPLYSEEIPFQLVSINTEQKAARLDHSKLELFYPKEKDNDHSYADTHTPRKKIPLRIKFDLKGGKNKALVEIGYNKAVY